LLDEVKSLFDKLNGLPDLFSGFFEYIKGILNPSEDKIIAEMTKANALMLRLGTELTTQAKG
jgi:hypothetical protein